MAEKYIIRVTAGTTRDPASHTEVPVNTPKQVKLRTELMDVEVNVRIQNYRGLPRGSPSTSPYFKQEPHAGNNDQYSIALRFTPKKPPPADRTPPAVEADAKENDDDAVDLTEEGGAEGGISGADLQFGNDFDRSIRDRLPPGFGTAMNIVKWWIDPGLEGDPFADRPYLYGPALSSFNAIEVGPGRDDEKKGGIWVTEGGDAGGMVSRRALGTPGDSKGRMKWALRAENKQKWLWEYGQTYAVDFFNPYLDFSEFALRLPGFQVPIMKYWDGQGLRANPRRSHHLRYVLRNRSTGDIYLVVLFTLYLKEDVNEDGSLKPSVIASTQKAPGGLSGTAADTVPSIEDEQKALEEAKRQLGGDETNDDDID